MTSTVKDTKLSVLNDDPDDSGDQELDDLLEAMPRPLQRRESSSTGKATGENMGSSNTLLARFASSKSKADDTSILSLKERASHVEPPNRIRTEFSTVTDVSLLGWHVEKKRERIKESFRYKIANYRPCRICLAGSNEYRAFEAQCENDKSNVVVQFLGVNTENKGHLQCIKRTQFVPYNDIPSLSSPAALNCRGRKRSRGSNTKKDDSTALSGIGSGSTDNDQAVKKGTMFGSSKPEFSSHEISFIGQRDDGWSATLFDIYKRNLRESKRTADKALRAKPVFWDKPYKQAFDDEQAAWFDYWMQIEENYLQNVFVQVWQQQRQREKSQANVVSQSSLEDDGQQHGSIERNEDGTNHIEDEETQLQPLHEKDDVATSLPSDKPIDDDDGDERTEFSYKLRAGDEIEYFPVASVVSAKNMRVGRIFCVHGKKQASTCLEMDNRQFVELSALVCLRRRLLRGRLIQVDQKKTLAVERYNLDTSMNGKVDFLRSNVGTSGMFSNVIEEAWTASCSRSDSESERVAHSCS